MNTIRQYQVGCVGLPAMQMFWTLGFHQCRLGYKNLSMIEDVVTGYRDANIPLEAIWTDFDMFDGFRTFENNPVTYPVDQMSMYIDGLHNNSQYYVPLIWPGTYRPNPNDPNDIYPTYQRGTDLDTWIRNPYTGDYYTGANWPGFTVWPDMMLPSSTTWWTNEISIWHSQVAFDGALSDLSEPASYCVGSCGDGRLTENPIHAPQLVPGDPFTIEYDYPEGFSETNSSDAVSASQAAASESAVSKTAYPLPSATTTTLGRTEPTPGVRNLTYPPYVLNR